MKRLGILVLLAFATACQSDQIGPVPAAEKLYSVTAANDDGPPTSFPFGPDTYRIGVYTGAGRHKLDCTTGTDGARDCEGFLRSSVDKTLLDVKLEIPPGTGPFPLVALIHGYAGSKNGSGDIAARLLGDGYAILRYSTRGFGKSWGQVNLADLTAEIGDLHSMIGEVVDEPSFNLNPDAVAVTGASYGGGHSWLALVQPTFVTHKKHTVRIRAVVPIAPWSDLLYSLLPNGRPNHSIDGLGGLKFTYVNGLYGSGIRKDPERPYPNYPEYFMAWHAAMNVTEPGMLVPPWPQIVDGVAGYRSIWWQQAFWDNVRQNRVPVFQVQGLTDDLFPLPEAKRMLLALKTVVPDYPITSYFGDLGHPRATNQVAEVDYVLGLIEPWLAYYLKGVGTVAPTPTIYIARTDEPFGKSPNHVRQLTDWSQLPSGGFITHEWVNDPTTTPALVNPVTFVESGVVWDPFVMTAEDMLPNTAPFPSPVKVLTSLNTVSIGARQMSGSGSFMIAGQPTVTLDALVRVGHRVQINVRLIDVGPEGDRLITRGTVTLEALTDLGSQTIVIPTYGNRWMVPSDHSIRLEISNVDSPYITPSREPSTTVINKITLQIPIE